MTNKKIIIGSISAAIIIGTGSYFIFDSTQKDTQLEKKDDGITKPISTETTTVPNQKELSAILNENGLEPTSHKDETNFDSHNGLTSIPLEAKTINNFRFSEPQFLFEFSDNNYSSMGKTIVQAYENFVLFQNENRQLFLINYKTNSTVLVANNITNYKKLSESEIIFTAQTDFNVFSAFYMNLDNESPSNNKFYEFADTPFGYTYGITNDFFFFKDKEYFSLVPYKIENNILSLLWSENDNVIFVDSLFKSHNNELYGYTGNSFSKYLQVNGYEFEEFLGDSLNLVSEGSPQFIINKQHSPNNTNHFYITSFKTDMDYGSVFINGIKADALSSHHTTWLDDRYILDLTLNNEIALYDTHNDTYEVLVENMYSAYLDKTNQKIYFTSYYNHYIMAISYEKD